MSCSEQFMRLVEPQWRTMLEHPFLRQTADGTLPAGRFETWLRQDYIFVRDDLGFVGSLIARAPLHLRRMLGEFIPALHHELDLFESMAKELGVNLDDIEASPVCHAYNMFLLATVHTRSFTESFTVLYASEKAYFDSWSQVKKLQTQKSPYQRFIDHWSSDAFAAWVQQLAQALDELAAGCGTDERKRMEGFFRLTLRYEYLFWDMALRGSGWPV
jgi:formylaminopyrimidine deformylase / aminopyrimidine aminohydrolase